MVGLISYFNPVSSQHHAMDDFQKLSGGKQFLTLAATVFATILSLPIAGLGGVAAFRAMVNKFQAVDLTHPESRAQADPALSSAINKTHSQYGKALKLPEHEQVLERFLSPGYKLEAVNLPPSQKLEAQPDAIFDVIGKEVNLDKETVVSRMKELIDNNPEIVTNLYGRQEMGRITEDQFKELLISENTPEKLRSFFPDVPLAFLVDTQFLINRSRCELLANALHLTIHAIEVTINKNGDMQGGPMPDIIEGGYVNATQASYVNMDITTKTPPKEIYLTYGNWRYMNMFEPSKNDSIFMQPRKIERKLS